jgi:hypothetical protein
VSVELDGETVVPEMTPSCPVRRIRERRDRVSPFSLAYRTWVPALALALASLALASTASAQEAPRLVGVEVEGTTLLDPARVAALSGLPGTQFLTTRDIQEAIRALWNTQLFDDVRLDSREAPGGVVALSTPNQRSVLDVVAGTLYRVSGGRVTAPLEKFYIDQHFLYFSPATLA